MLIPQRPILDYDTFGPELERVLEAIHNRLHRDPSLPRLKEHPGIRPLMLGLLRAAQNTYSALKFLLADLPKSPGRRPQLALATTPIVRGLVDVICIIVFVFGDVHRRTDWFYKSGYRESREEHERLQKKYGADPVWQNWLQAQAESLQLAEREWHLTASEIQNLKTIKYWLIPSQMLKYPELSEDRRNFLQFLYDWYYRSFSQDSHLSWPGLARRTISLERDVDEKDRDAILEEHKGKAMSAAVVVMASIASELELEFKFGYSEGLAYVWGILTSHDDMAAEIHQNYYAKFFKKE